MNWSVVYWNVAKNTEAAAALLEGRREFDIIALQEVPRNQETGRAYCPGLGRYRLIYEGKGRAALYIHKRHTVAGWSQDSGEDWCSVIFGNGPEALTIWSIYSPYDSERGEDGL